MARTLRLDRLAPAAQRAATPPASLAEMRTPDPGRARLGAGGQGALGLRDGRGVPPHPARHHARRGRHRPPGGAHAGGRVLRRAGHALRPAGGRARDGARADRGAGGRGPRGGQRLGLQRARQELRRAAGRRPGVGRAGGAGGGADPRPDRARPPPRDAGLGRVAVHDACHHIHAQGIGPRAMLSAAGADCVDLGDGGRCCGAAGLYSVLQPELASRLRRQKATRSPRPAPRSWPSPTPAARSRSPPGCARWARRSGSPTPPSCSPPSRRPGAPARAGRRSSGGAAERGGRPAPRRARPGEPGEEGGDHEQGDGGPANQTVSSRSSSTGATIDPMSAKTALQVGRRRALGEDPAGAGGHRRQRLARAAAGPGGRGRCPAGSCRSARRPRRRARRRPRAWSRCGSSWRRR